MLFNKYYDMLGLTEIAGRQLLFSARSYSASLKEMLETVVEFPGKGNNNKSKSLSVRREFANRLSVFRGTVSTQRQPAGVVLHLYTCW